VCVCVHACVFLFVAIQEVENHSFFMTKAPEAGEPMSLLMEGL
jgi:hypothetical protein